MFTRSDEINAIFSKFRLFTLIPFGHEDDSDSTLTISLLEQDKMPLFSNDNHYEGFIKVNDKRYFIEARLQSSSTWEAKDIIVDWRLHSLLNDLLYNFIEENSKNIEFNEFFDKLENFVKSSLTSNEKSDLWTHNPTKAYNFYKCLEQEINEVEEYIKDVNVEDGIVHVEAIDSALRVHRTILKLTENYPKDLIKIISHDLPLNDGNLPQKGVNLTAATTISTFCKRFTTVIDSFQEFWNSVSLLDSNCWVLDPENPTYKDITRRIKISDRISVVLVFNPYMGRQRPDIKFLGCHSTVTEFREILQKNLENEVWDENEDVLTNLMNLLEVTFPSKPEKKEEDDSLNLVHVGECAICFLMRLEDEIPSIICDNHNCMTHYHVTCLFKYLSSVPGNKNYFGRIQGECPNCEQGISCPLPNLS